MIITLVAGGVAAVIVAIVLVIALSGRGGGGGGAGSGASPGDTVKAYLEALSKGDAEAALAFGIDQPASKGLLTDDILQRQLAKAPISNVRILGEDKTMADIGQSTVHVAANFGDDVSDATITVKKVDDGWKLPTASIKVAPSPGADSNEAQKTVTVFDKPASGTIYVFPGFLAVGSSNPYVTVTAKPMLLDDLSTFSMAWLDTTFTLNDKGKTAIATGLTDSFATCQRSNLISPPGCPARLFVYDAVEGSVSWGVTDLSGVKTDLLDPYRLKVSLTGEATTPIAYKTQNGDTKTDVDQSFVSGDVDLTKTPLVVNLS